MGDDPGSRPGQAREPGGTPEGGRPAGEAEAVKPSLRRRNAIVFACVALVWLAFDLASKAYFDANYQPFDVITGPMLGLFRFELLHNTGAAWGLFGDATFVLGIAAVAVCALLVIYLFVLMPRANLGETIGLALVFAGGLGNAIGRFVAGYVTDFISLTFMSFPVFNVADIGVTCGVVVFIVSMLVGWARGGDAKKAKGAGEK